MRMQRIGKMTAVLGVSAVLLSGCGLFGPEKEVSSIDAPPLSEVAVEVPDVTEEGSLEQPEALEQGTAERTVYLLDANGYVVPVSLTLPKVEGLAKQALSYMVKGGPVETLLQGGFSAVLPQGTEVKGLLIKNGVATVDFSKEFKTYEEKDEKKILDAVTRVLTEFGNVKTVQIWVNGTPLKEMPVASTPINQLDRNLGVNLELADGAIPGSTSAVTVYFQGQLDDARTYFVPVTRLIPTTQNVAKATVEELIKGPKQDSQLFSSLLRTTRVLDVKQDKDLITVNLSSDILKYDEGKDANPDALESLVLSLTESTGAKQVQLLVEGKPLTSEAHDFSKPVARPLHVNPIRF
ncbi:GerMN domain-containing protein [Brevibacillus invocatus]|uniref:GerMN domain-containing protein n=1 Tax=Brevibacillus invocatus TaxID=173959 RepID=UPI00203FC7C4|nr:GerMN domain-containing protein [Brevibacillus invocatus]MCM3078100.1 GerMN domain-containing protein [Brevibacillus invocatus]MCM3428314.1 GerMN domain-containing protein [Brevibacillus invocatus]